MAYSPIDPQALARRTGSWLSSEGPEADVVVSSRVRLARNIEGAPFMSRISGEQAEELSQTLRGALLEASIDG
ncbi:MAG: hypothetical protein P8R43_03900, partial [Planctomycetota bacterium]|nr:hypothetical protein [Planctomycetota bacterium]